MTQKAGTELPMTALAFGAVGVEATAVDATHGLPVSLVASDAAASGLATAANQATQITAEQAILAKIIAAPSTEAKQDTGNTSLASILAKQPALGTVGTPSADVISIQEPTSNLWRYAAAASGISNTTTAVTIAAAAGASVRNFIDGFQIMWEALGTATEIAIRDGAAGTVIWRMKIPAGVAGTIEPPLLAPLKGTANTLLEVVTLTASGTGAVYFNAQGHTGS